MFHIAKLSTLCGFTKGVSMDILYLLTNDILEYNLPNVQSNFMWNLGLTKTSPHIFLLFSSSK